MVKVVNAINTKLQTGSITHSTPRVARRTGLRSGSEVGDKEVTSVDRLFGVRMHT